MKNTLVIFGSYPDGREGFQWNRQDCDLWVFNEAVSRNEWIAWCTAVFQMHVPAIWRNPLNINDHKHYDWLKKNDAIPVYMLEKYPDVPMAVKYPLDEIVTSLLPNFSRDPNEVWDDHGMYATSSLAEALALGIYQGYRRIELWGVGLAMNTEYVFQRPGATFWIGYALGRGIEVLVKGHMFDAPLYGYNGDIYLDLQMFRDRLAGLDQLLPQAEIALGEQSDRVRHAVEDYKESKIPGEALVAVYQAKAQAVVDRVQIQGIIEENKMYVHMAEEMITASGEDDFRFSRSRFEIRQNMLRKECGRLLQTRAPQQVLVDKAYAAIDKTDSYKKRCRAIDAFVDAYEADLVLMAELAAKDAQSTENRRYMSILDEQYRAAGGEKSVKVLEGLAAEEQ